jgi:transposase
MAIIACWLKRAGQRLPSVGHMSVGASTSIRGQPADARRAVRQERSRPILAEFEPWLREKLGLISQKTKLAEAIRYTLSRWDGLARFLDDGRIELDSNTVERAIRPQASVDSLYPSSSSIWKH